MWHFPWALYILASSFFTPPFVPEPPRQAEYIGILESLLSIRLLVRILVSNQLKCASPLH